MTDQVSGSNTIRKELVDIAIGFLQNPKIIDEQMQRKREFLQKKGLTDTEINYAFQLIPQQEIISNQQPSFFRRFLNDLTFAGLLILIIKMTIQFFHSDQSDEKNILNETIQNLQKSLCDMQASIVKLEQTADQLNSTTKISNPNRSILPSVEEIKQEIQALKELFRNR